MKKIYIILIALLTMPFAAQAQCTGTGNTQDGEYYSTDHCKEWTNGYSWDFQTVAGGIQISVTSLDDFEGMGAAYLFDRTNNGFAEYQMTLNGKTATYTLQGYSQGQAVSFVVKFLVAGGDIFTKRFAYSVGDNCQQGTAAACSGHSTQHDVFYTEHDAAATSFERGYDWKMETTPQGVKITVEFLEQWVGMAAPYLFEFHENGTMNEHQMQWAGQVASYTLSGYNEGEEVTILVKIAYALHVAFTQRLTYTVGSACNPSDAITDVIADKNIDFNAPMEIFNALGAKVNADFNSLPKGVYIIRQGKLTRKVMR